MFSRKSTVRSCAAQCRLNSRWLTLWNGAAPGNWPVLLVGSAHWAITPRNTPWSVTAMKSRGSRSRISTPKVLVSVSPRA